MGVLSACLLVYLMHTWCPLKMLDPLEMELQIVKSHDVGARNQI